MVLDQVAEPAAVHFDAEVARSTFFEDRSWFPPGSVEFDSALIMRNIEHEWRRSESLRLSA